MIAKKTLSKEDLLMELRSLLRKDKQYHLYYSLLELITTNRLITAKAIAEVGFMPIEISNDLEFEWGQQYPALKGGAFAPSSAKLTLPPSEAAGLR